MDGKVTSLVNPKDPKDIKSFTYDYSYWSHDGFREGSLGYHKWIVKSF